jgi:predicted lipid-binding transport protein (Tim44 family)
MLGLMMQGVGLGDLFSAGTGGTWLMVFLLILAVLLIRVVLDIRKDGETHRQETAHMVTAPFVGRVVENAQLRQLKRIQSAWIRANGKDGTGRFDLELQREIDLLAQNGQLPDEDAPGRPYESF